MKPLRILIAEDEPTTVMTLTAYFGKREEFELVGTATNGEAALKEALALKPDVLLCDIAMPKMDGLAVTQKLKESLPACVVVILSGQDTSEYAKLAIEAGASDYIHKSVEMHAVPLRVLDIVRRERQLASSMEQREAEQAAKIFAFYSPNGGSGSSSLAINSALQLVRHQQRVLLIDLNLQFGDVEFLLDLTHRNSISSIVNAWGELMEFKVGLAVEPHKSGLRVMYKHELRESEKVTPQVVGSLLEHARQKMAVDFVLLDLDSHIDGRTLAALDMADALFVVVAEKPLAIKNCKRALEVFLELGYEGKMKLLVNKVAGSPQAFVEKVLGPRFASFPEDSALFEQSERSGFPPIIEKPSSPFAQAIADLVASSMLLRKPPEEEGGVARVKRLFERLFS
jgi:pilus assembly protein CpaE